jgi:hypothetical protein
MRWKTGAPGAHLEQVRAATISASPWTIVPAIEARPVEPARHRHEPTGSPASAKTSADSRPSASCASGAMQQTSD